MIGTGFHPSKAFEVPTIVDSDTANSYLTLLRRYVNKKFCYHSDAASEGKIIKSDSRVAFQIDIWTLMEKRWIKTISSPYNGEDTPGEIVEDIFDKETYNLKADTTIIQRNQIGQIILPETQKKISCAACNGQRSIYELCSNLHPQMSSCK
ncbi:unnamed protein product [Didymodactylos carnosus]|uniref:Uncharacterized protein n=1 Tax=Didymodactylos carnosus TaxID=1234261 RepID=A0A814IJQ9_9BILA|nr:unnamed protein product [Didymodactylos carnosus]CAF1398669.1 unnamed protein product [Didymodactylos carnosus]CAF3793778.1 unnamed protein product [Didymodactylos carnosus]CAF4206047.1 unnamed protein product [Didymodactylos carnosus]